MLDEYLLEVLAEKKKPTGNPAGFFCPLRAGYPVAERDKLHLLRPPKFFFACRTDLLIWQ
jgi:hypothetical protein